MLGDMPGSAQQLKRSLQISFSISVSPPCQPQTFYTILVLNEYGLALYLALHAKPPPFHAMLDPPGNVVVM